MPGGRTASLPVSNARHNVPLMLQRVSMDTPGVDDRYLGCRSTRSMREGRIYGRCTQDSEERRTPSHGRGTEPDCDVRGGLERVRLLVTAVPDEDHASAGAEALVAAHTANAPIVTEPTDQRPATVARGIRLGRERVTRGRVIVLQPSGGGESRHPAHGPRSWRAWSAPVDSAFEAGPVHPRLGRGVARIRRR